MWYVKGRPGDVFTFSSLCNERLGHLVACHRDEENGGRKRNDSVSSTDDEEDDNEFIHVQSQGWDFIILRRFSAEFNSIWTPH